MALANQAALLDELMGVYRNNSVDSKKVMRWDEDNVCKYYLAGFCPHDLFTNTKEQLGPCPNHHDQNLLAKYKESRRYRKMGFEKNLKSFLEKFLQRRETRIVFNRDRINDGPLSGMEMKKMEIIEKNKIEIDEMIENIRKLANEGKIGESQLLFTQLEEKKSTLKYDVIDLEKQKLANKIKEDDVCETCGAMVSKNDPRNGLDNHENGRIHLGYKEIDGVLIDLKELIIKIDANEDFTGENDSSYRRNKNEKLKKEDFINADEIKRAEDLDRKYEKRRSDDTREKNNSDSSRKRRRSRDENIKHSDSRSRKEGSRRRSRSRDKRRNHSSRDRSRRH